MPDSTEGDSDIVVTPLDSSTRQVLKGTLVPIKIAQSDSTGNGLIRYSTVVQMALVRGETDTVHNYARSQANESLGIRISPTTLNILRGFEAPHIPTLSPSIADVASIPPAELLEFSRALLSTRTQQLPNSETTQLPALKIAKVIQSINVAAIAEKTLSSTAQPIGMLNLERIEMVPAGIQRGELVATIPLAPGEETAVTHKEWSVTSKEFTKIVTDSLEEISETGVTDNTDLSQSTTSQSQHSSQFNITGTVQGGIPIINGSSSAGASAQDARSQSATDSIKHARSITQKASARSRQEHKTTISTKTVTGTSETSTRVLKNPSTTDPIRIDYFSIMRKWRVRLYRYGLRLTYDIVIPQPGATLRRIYAAIDDLKKQLGPFVFNLDYNDIDPAIVEGKPRYIWLAEQYEVAVKPYPSSPSPIFRNVTGVGNSSWSYLSIEFNVPAGTRIQEMYLSAIIGNNVNQPRLRVLGARLEPNWIDKDNLNVNREKVLADDGSPFMKGATGDQKVTFWMHFTNAPSLSLEVILETVPDVIDQWRNDVWHTLYNAAQTKYYAKQQDIASQIAALEETLSNVDTLTLRREEGDEVMKGALKFLLGTDFEFMHPDVVTAFKEESADYIHGVSFDGQSLSGLDSVQWTNMQRRHEMVRFINQAIEWENVVTFLYSYFWDLPTSWDFVRQIRHPDLTRQAFLRAGSARVVLTVRKGWEEKWMRFVKDGTVDADIGNPNTGPYLSIAQEIAAYDDRNYPGIPPANPERAAVRLHDAVYSTSTEKILAGNTAVSISVSSSDGFIVGLPVVLDVEDERHVQESTLILEIPDASHIVVEKVTHTHDGTERPFPILQPGDKGALIAEWNEYTPSSGIDIDINSSLNAIA